MTNQSEVIEKAKKITLLLMDCDGVLTDGKLYFSEKGEELKVFHVRDGQGLMMWHTAGFRSGIITGRNSKMLERRANELKIDFLKQNSKNKLECFQEIIEKAKVSTEEVAFVGDDVQDIILFQNVGLPIAVADAHKEIFHHVLHKTRLKGGSGAIREVIDLLMKSKQKNNLKKVLTSLDK